MNRVRFGAVDRAPDVPQDVQLFRGRLVRLAAFDPDADAGPFAAWHDDAGYLRLSGDDVAKPMGAAEARSVLEAWARGWPESVTFAVRTLADDRLVGLARLYDIIWTNGHAILGLSIPAPDDRGKGSGRDALDLILRYGFDELGLHRIWLDVMAYNERAIRLYASAGFREEGRLREHLHRDGRRWDVVLMGILRDEFERPGP